MDGGRETVIVFGEISWLMPDGWGDEIGSGVDAIVSTASRSSSG